MSELSEQMIQDMKARGLSPRTQDSYVNAVRRLAKRYDRSPELITEREVQAHLLESCDRGLSWSTVNGQACAIRFFYSVTLKRDCDEFEIPASRKPVRLPEILSREEIQRLFAVTANLKHRALLMTAYGAGLRASEVARLQVDHLDSEREMIRVEQGKGQKDRYTILPAELLRELRDYFRRLWPETWLFPSRRGGGPLSQRSVGRIYTGARDRAGIRKAGGIHALRHAFATHLIEDGTELHVVQRLLGHRRIHTTMRYLHLTRVAASDHETGLDLLAALRPGAS